MKPSFDLSGSLISLVNQNNLYECENDSHFLAGKWAINWDVVSYRTSANGESSYCLIVSAVGNDSPTPLSFYSSHTQYLLSSFINWKDVCFFIDICIFFNPGFFCTFFQWFIQLPLHIAAKLPNDDTVYCKMYKWLTTILVNRLTEKPWTALSRRCLPNWFGEWQWAHRFNATKLSASRQRKNPRFFF